MRAAFMACIALLAACTASGDSETLLGRPCSSAADCDAVVGICITDGRDGMCSSACEAPGYPGACPLGNYCDSVKVGTDTRESSDMVLCLPACERDDDCRDGYNCTGVSGGPGKVCKP